MTAEAFLQLLRSQMPFAMTGQQEQVAAALSRFLTEGTLPHEPERAFILNGHAGTGKTTLMGALVSALALTGHQAVLLAPTGRAAKVLGSFAGRRAYTIHRHLYRFTPDGSVNTAENRLTNTLFIVDEASMIGDSTEGYSSLLSDLVHYVYSGEGCRLLLVGDTAQLPPVGTTLSPAMNPDVLRSFGLRVSRVTLTETVRQRLHSGLLHNATLVRRSMKEPLDKEPPRLRASGFDDVRVAEGEDLADLIAQDYADDGQEATILITRSNNRATRYNLAIRSLINMSEEELVRGERLMVVKNSYHWTRETPGMDFIANGDMAVVNRIDHTESRYGLRFADVELSLPDREATVNSKIILDSLTTDHPALGPENEARLRESVLYEAAAGTGGLSMTAAARVLRADPYYNALRVKYAYAITCHKAQGGQWPNVYVDLGYLGEDPAGLDFRRWLYTAVTRAQRRLTLVTPALEVR